MGVLPVEQPQARWPESWSVREVDAAGWERLQAALRQEYDTLRNAIAANAARLDWSQPMFLPGTMALVPHAAYHLGAIRQMAAAVNSQG